MSVASKSKCSKDIVIVDICGTIFDSNTTMDFLDYTFGNHRSYKVYRRLSKCIFVRAINKISINLFNIDPIRYIGIKFLSGVTSGSIKKYVDDFYNYFLAHKINAETVNLISKFQSDGYRLILVSATLDCIASKVANVFKIDGYISSELLYENNICKGRLHTDLLNRKPEYITSFGITPPYAITISDNLSDAILMSQSKYSYIISNPINCKKWNNIIRKYSINNYKVIIP